MAQDLGFFQLLDKLDNFPSVRLAQMAVSSSQSQLNILSSPVKAELSAGYTKTWGQLKLNNKTTSLDAEDISPISLSANFNVIPYGPVYDQIVEAGWNLELAKSRLKEQKNAEIIKLFKSVNNVITAQKQITLAEARLEQNQLQLQKVRALLAGGAANQAGLEQIQIKISQSQNAVISQKQNYQQALRNLSLISGQEVGNIKDEVIELSELNYEIEQAIENRSDLISARQKLLRASMQAESSLRDQLPYGTVSTNYMHSTDSDQFSLGGSFNTKSFQPSLQGSYDPDYKPQAAVAGQSSDSYSISLKLVVPLDASLSEALELSRILIKQAELQYRQSREMAKLDISAKENALSAAQANLSLATAMLEQAKHNLEINQARFEAGIISKLDLVSAKNDLLEAQINRQTAKNQELVAAMQLASALSFNLTEVIK